MRLQTGQMPALRFAANLPVMLALLLLAGCGDGVVQPQPAPESVTLNEPALLASGVVLLTWTPSSAGDFMGYRIYRSTNAGVNDASTPIYSGDDPAVDTCYDYSVSPGTHFYYRLYVLFQEGQPAVSNVVNVAIPP